MLLGFLHTGRSFVFCRTPILLVFFAGHLSSLCLHEFHLPPGLPADPPGVLVKPNEGKFVKLSEAKVVEPNEAKVEKPPHS